MTIPHAKTSSTRSPFPVVIGRPTSNYQLLDLDTSNGVRGQVKRVREEKIVLCLNRKNSVSADNLDLSRVQRLVWDTKRRYGKTCNLDSPRFSLLLNRTVFTPRKDPLRPPPVLAIDYSQETSGELPRKRLSGELCSRPSLLESWSAHMCDLCLTLNQERPGRRRRRRRCTANFQRTAP